MRWAPASRSRRHPAAHAQARALFAGWQAQDAPRLISVVNLSEVLVAEDASQSLPTDAPADAVA